MIVPGESADSLQELPLTYVCSYRYENPDGSLALEVVRYRGGPRGKSFRYRYRLRPTGVWIPRKPPGAESALYHLASVLAAVAAGAPIFWCEGEADADAVLSACPPGVAATTHHGGAGHATAEQAAHFKGHTGHVFILTDRDEDPTKGSYRAGAACAWERYGLLRSRAVNIPASRIHFRMASQGKDVRDHLAAGLSLSELIRVPKDQVREWHMERVAFVSAAKAESKATGKSSEWIRYAIEKGN